MIQRCLPGRIIPRPLLRLQLRQQCIKSRRCWSIICNPAYSDNHDSSFNTCLVVRYRSSSSSSSTRRPDPFARRPTSKCDPYGQSGKPLTLGEATQLHRTVEPEWKLLINKDDSDKDCDFNMLRNRDGGNNDDDSNDNNKFYDNKCYDENFVPFGIGRDFWHEDYTHGAQFLTHVAAVAQMNAQHFPHRVTLERKIQGRSGSKSWNICTRVICSTHVLQGLSHHDFYLATLIDIEIERPEVRKLLIFSTQERKNSNDKKKK